MENELTNITISHPPLINKLLRMMRAMIAFEPVMANVIAISLAIGALLLLSHPTLFPKLGKYHNYLAYFLYALIVIQTIKSSTKSLLIPLSALAIAGLNFIALSINPDWIALSIEYSKMLMLLGVIGIATSIIVIR